MADLAAANSGLQSLASEDVDVTTEGNTTRILVRYLDTTSTGSAETDKASHEFTVDFIPDAGEYKLSSTQRSSTTGPTGGGLSIQKNSGNTKSFSFSKTSGPDGTVTSSFSSKPWEDSIRQHVEAAGWARKKGVLGKLFGR